MAVVYGSLRIVAISAILWNLKPLKNHSTQAYSCKKPETPDISRCPAGLIFDHASEGFWREGIAWAMKRNRHSTAVRVAVLLVAPTLRTQEESVTDQGADDLPCRE
jgi:hypothetical protein